MVAFARLIFRKMICYNLRFLLISGILICDFDVVKCQTYYFDTYSTTEGASSKIYTILQDNFHYIWLGTPGGVSRFDGKSFENFTNENGLAPQGVRTIFQDSYKNIWFGHSGGGISLLRNGKFNQYTYLDSLIQSDITSIFEDHLHRMWITTEKSGAFMVLNALDSIKSEATHFVGKHNLSDRVYNYCRTKNNSIYLITDVGIKKFIETENTFQPFHLNGLSNYFSIITMYEGHNNILWFGTYHGGLYKYDPGKDTVAIFDIRDGLSSNWVSAITQDRRGNMWIGTFGGGVTKINDKEIKIYNIKNGLEAERIFSIIEDVEGNILIGSSDKGLAIFKGDMFENYSEKEGLKNPEVYAILQDKNMNFWIGSNNGITVFDKSLDLIIKTYNINDFLNKKLGISSNNKIRFLRIDKNNCIWIGTDDQRLLFYDAHSGQFDEPSWINDWFAGTESIISAMEIDKSNRLWIGTHDGLLRFDINHSKIERISNETGLVGNDISAIYCDPQNQLWVGAYVKDGISKITGDNNIENFRLGEAVTPSCMVKDSKGKLWIGTKGHGVFLLKNDSVTGRMEINDGLLSNLINTLNIDKLDNIYIGTNKGLNVYNQQKDKIYTYNQKNGFIGIETNPSASYVDDENNIWFGTNNGVNKFNPDALKEELNQPLVYLTKVSINQIEREFASGLKLKYYENHISIYYKSICLTNPDAVRYRVMLEGVDNDWQEITSQTGITYPALPPNKYRFKVIARNSDGIWNTDPATFDFEILSPFYQRWYFILAAILLTIVVMRLYIKIREKHHVREKKVLEEKVKERTVELRIANDELADKNKNITDSIRYAQRIQQSILPPVIPFDNMFVLFKPKDIVSGDFYWMTTIENKEIIAAIDCTGHGVPGAFMSFIGYSSLNEVVKEKSITKPSLILDKLNEEVMTALNSENEEGIKDGMDLALVCFDRKNKILEYAGAYNPLYLLRAGELTEIKADRFSIGKSMEKEKNFTNHSVTINNGDTIYIFSDGYVDQFGGENEKKFRAGALKELLIRIQDKNMDEQKEILDATIENWRGKLEQIDDILVIGRRF